MVINASESGKYGERMKRRELEEVGAPPAGPQVVPHRGPGAFKVHAGVPNSIG